VVVLAVVVVSCCRIVIRNIIVLVVGTFTVTVMVVLLSLLYSIRRRWCPVGRRTLARKGSTNWLADLEADSKLSDLLDKMSVVGDGAGRVKGRDRASAMRKVMGSQMEGLPTNGKWERGRAKPGT
jgi:hypothetical protein